MRDIETAVQNLAGHSICLCKDGVCITDDGRGISPMMRLLEEGKDLTGYSAADLIVGKAAAMLFVKAGIVCVYGKTMSEAGSACLTAHGIPHFFDTMTEHIINRTGTGICPMEEAVADIEDIGEGYAALKKRLAALSRQ